MNDLMQIDSCPTLAADLDAIQQARPRFVLRAFVAGQHDTPGQQWAQSVLEIEHTICALANAKIDREIAELKIARLEQRGMPIAALKAKKIRIDLKRLEWAETGSKRELRDLLAIKAELEAAHGGRGWTREELDAEQPEYWRRRLGRQAMLDVNAHGRIGVGNQDALRMAGMPVPGQPGYIRSVEQRMLENGKVRILVATPTLIPREEILAREEAGLPGLKCREGWQLPGFVQYQPYCITGLPIADAYTDAALHAMDTGATHILTVEDDHVIPQGTFERLWSVYQQHGPRAIVGAWYPQKKEPRTGAPICLRRLGHSSGASSGQHDDRKSEEALGSQGVERVRGGIQGICEPAAGEALPLMEMQLSHREYLADVGGVHEVLSCPMGFTLIPTSAFREIPQPWFATTGALTQDSFFSQLAREAGYRLLVDTGARIKHVCRETGRVYE